MLEQIRPGAEVTADKLFLVESEVGQHQAEGFLDALQPAAGIFAHDVDLQNTLAVVMLQRRVMAGGVFLGPRLGFQPDGHGRAEYRQSLLQDDDPLFVQIHQGALQGRVDILQFRTQPRVALDRLSQLFKRKLDQQVRAGGRIGRHFREEKVQHQRGHAPPFLGQFAHVGPAPSHPNAIRIHGDIAQIDAAMSAGESAPVFTQALKQ